MDWVHMSGLAMVIPEEGRQKATCDNMQVQWKEIQVLGEGPDKGFE